MNPAVRLMLDLLFPPKCMLCHRVMEHSRDALCGRCGIELPEYEGALRKVPEFSRFVAPFYYRPPIRDAVLRFKFRGMQEYARQFAAWMSVWVRDHLSGEFDVISWVPCSGPRKWKRGFDQAELLARELGRILDMPVLRTLKKVRHNPAQSGTKNAARRKANVIGVYRPYRPELVAGKRILLVDDVLTTGATMTECGKVLQLAGAGQLVGAAVAVTEAHKDK